jgi:iron complex transport system substrate-binding protein
VPIAAAAVALGACSTDPVAEDSAPSGDGEPTTMTVESPFGEVEMPAEPQRALGMYTTDVDILITLGFPLADQQPIRGDGYDDFPDFFPQEPLEGVTPFANYPDYNYEMILQAQPDFILNGLGYDKKVNKRLPEIAPTYSVNAYDGRSWREHFAETAQALGRTEEHDAWVAEYDARIEEVKAELGPEAADLVVAPLAYWQGEVTSACYTSVECAVVEDLGMTVWAGAKKDDNAGVTLSSEQLAQLEDLDVALTYYIPSEDGEKELDAMYDELAKNEIWNDLPVVQNDAFVEYDLEMTFGSPSGQMAFLDRLAEELGNG